jgi:hypothetical protein
MAINWKDALLGSGVPLEYSVRSILEKLGISDTREYKYLRPNEDGVETEFSIDLQASHINLEKMARLGFLLRTFFPRSGHRRSRQRLCI